MYKTNSEKALLLKRIGIDVSYFENHLKNGLDDQQDLSLNNLYQQNFDRIQNEIFKVQINKDNNRRKKVR